MSRTSAIFGRRGKGKTTLAMKIANDENRGTLAFDPSGAIDVGVIVHAGGATQNRLREAVALDVSPVVFKTDFGDDIEECFDDFAKFAYSLQDVSVVVDEASNLQSPQWIHPYLDSLIRYARRRNLTVITTQHLVKDANDVNRALATDFYFFETSDAKDLDKIEFFTNAECRRAVEALRALEFVHFDVESKRIVVNADPDSWKFNLGKQPLLRTEETCPTT